MSINEVIAQFNFKNVRAYMEQHNWYWRDQGRVPTIAELKETADHVMQEAFSNESGYCASGGFEAERIAYGISLRFAHVVEEVLPELETA